MNEPSLDPQAIDDLLATSPEKVAPPGLHRAATSLPFAYRVAGLRFEAPPSLTEDAGAEEPDDADDSDVPLDLSAEVSATPGFDGSRDPDAKRFAAFDMAPRERPAPDLAVFDGGPNLLELDLERGQPLAPAAFAADVTGSACDTIASLARDRALLPMESRADTEVRILEQVDALVSLGADFFPALVGYAVDALDAANPWTAWAPCFVYGCLAGRAPLRAVADLLHRFAPDDVDRSTLIAEALSLAPHPELRQLASALRRSHHPVARAVGLDLLDRQGHDPERLVAALGDASPTVVLAAARALGRSVTTLGGDQLMALLDAPTPGVSLAAARLLLVRGDRTAYDALRRGDALSLTHFPHALDIFVMAGRADDIERMEKLVRGWGPSAHVLNAVARFGHPRSWAYLVHHLGDDDHADAAADALELLFGLLVEPEERLMARAWRVAIASASFDEGMRYRGGVPWSAKHLVDVARSGRLDRIETARAMDEVRARCRLPHPVDLAAWTPHPEEQLSAFASQHKAVLAGFAEGSWA